MESIWIDRDIVSKLAYKIKYSVDKLPKLNVYDEKLYPSRRDDLESILRYFLVVVALDHRLSRPGRPYRHCFNSECYKGADLLYYLSKKIYDENPSFYNPENLSKIKPEDVEKIYSIGKARVPDPVVRAYLLRDLGFKLTRLYNRSVLELLEKSGSRIRGSIDKPGLVDLLRVFRAYEDPVEKKSFLFIKFLILRELFKPVDPWNMEVPVDNHLTRIALRIGVVGLKGVLWRLVKESKPVDYGDDVLIRFMVRRAYKLVSIEAGVDPCIVDDALWVYGRKVCLRDQPPKCSMCLFKDFCRAYMDREYMVSEHNYYNTWYY